MLADRFMAAVSLEAVDTLLKSSGTVRSALRKAAGVHHFQCLPRGSG